jgi:hypothetical protein
MPTIAIQQNTWCMIIDIIVIELLLRCWCVRKFKVIYICICKERHESYASYAYEHASASA